jgi:hypothetical protein
MRIGRVTIGIFLVASCQQGGGGPLHLAPVAARVPTCTMLHFSAIDDASGGNAVVHWSVTGAGSIDTQGVYTAPLLTPSPPQATVTATRTTNDLQASAEVTLATAFAGTPVLVSPIDVQSSAIYPHTIAAWDTRTYAVWAGLDASSSWGVFVSVSDDGQSWSTPQRVNDNDGSTPLTCASVAVDPADPDVAYVVYRADSGVFSQSAAITGTVAGATVVYAVSSDAGATFRNTVLASTFTSDYARCPDIASPAANTVVVSAPALALGDPDTACSSSGCRRIDLWSDASRGTSWQTAEYDQAGSYYYATGRTRALADVGSQGAPFDFVAQASGSESPRLFAGAGKLCLAYVAGWNSPERGFPYAQCSADAGQSFSESVQLDPEANVASVPTGAVSPGGEVSLVWWKTDTNELRLAQSADGVTFPTARPLSAYVDGQGLADVAWPDVAYDDSGILWLAYAHGSATASEIVIVDKSCDGGTSWSGPIIADEDAGSFMPAVAASGGLTRVSSYLNRAGANGVRLYMTPLE